MRILLTGATGFLGRHISNELIRAGHDIVPVSRQSGLDLTVMHQPSDWESLLGGVEAVINCAGIISESGTNSFTAIHTLAPVALFDACVIRGVKRVIQISALGVENPDPTPYQSSKAKADHHLQNLPLDWFILRPSLVYGPGGTSTTFFIRLACLPIVPLIAQGRQRIQPVHIDDVVACVLQCLHEEKTRQLINVVGPEQISFAQWLLRLRKLSGKGKAMTISMPYALVRMFAYLVGPFILLFNPDNLRMLQQGNTAEVQPFAELLGRMPRVVP